MILIVNNLGVCISEHCKKVQACRRKKQLAAEAHRLPVNAARDNLIKLVKENRVVVLVGETGSGKTTQIPQYLYQARLGGDGLIACTQPRRVAAVSVARRVAEEMGTVLGDKVSTLSYAGTSCSGTGFAAVSNGRNASQINGHERCEMNSRTALVQKHV